MTRDPSPRKPARRPFRPTARLVVLLSAVFALLPAPAIAPLFALGNGTVPLASRPDWVRPLRLDAASSIDPSLVDYGFYYLLNDRQVRVSTGEAYSHLAFRVLTHAGLEEASRIEISYQPAFQSLELHGVTRYRDGRAADCTRNIRWNELQREDSLDSGLYDESRTMLLILEDMREGDVVEYDYTVRGTNPIFGSRFYETFSHGLEYPMLNLQFRLLVPPGRTFRTRQHVREIPETRAVLADGTQEVIWAEEGSPGVRSEALTPDWFDTWPWIEASEWQSWQEVGDWGVSVFGQAAARSPGATGDEKALMQALRFVQDEIRYFGIEIGVNSHRPRSPAEVEASRFGDCKDKALLFCEMARKAGWEAWPVLVNSTAGRNLRQWLPSPAAFDHVIAAVRFPGGIRWFDPTISYQGGSLGDTWVPDYGQVLVLDGGAGEPVRMPAENPGDTDGAEEYRSSGYEGEGELAVVTRCSGREADLMRYRLATTGRSSMEKGWLDFYLKSFPAAVRNGAIGISDDREGNTVEIRESYRIPGLWNAKGDGGPGQRSLYVYPYTFSSKFWEYDDITGERKTPLAIEYPYRGRHRITVELGGTGDAAPEVGEEEYSSDNPWYRLESRVHRNGRTVELDYRFEPLQETVAAADLPGFRRQIEKDRDGELGCTLRKPEAWHPGRGMLPLGAVISGIILVLTGTVAYRKGFRDGRGTGNGASGNGTP